MDIEKDQEWLDKKADELLNAAGLSEDTDILDMMSKNEYAPTVYGYLDLLGDITTLVLQRVANSAADDTKRGWYEKQEK